MKQWSTCVVDDVRLGNVVEIDDLVDEIVGKEPPGKRDAPDSIYLVTREHGPINVHRSFEISVYR